ncbi:hypothetical protein EJB05_48941, partial [Eragrostis curvula]
PVRPTRPDASVLLLPPPPPVRSASDGPHAATAAVPALPTLIYCLLQLPPPRLRPHACVASSFPSSPPHRDRNGIACASAMAPSLLGGFTKSLAMTVLSEIGDKTFFAAAVRLLLTLPPPRLPRLPCPVCSFALSPAEPVWLRSFVDGWHGSVPHVPRVCLPMLYVYLCKILAMRHPRKLVLAGCLCALIVMTVLSASLGWVAPNLISRKWTHHVTTLLFFVFGIWSLWEGFKEDGDSEELAEVEAELDAAFKSNKGESKNKSKANDDTKKQQRPFLMQFFSPIFIKAFSITFFGEWGDKSQIATIGLAADENPFGVVLGGIIAQALCTTAAVLGGKSLASQISEKMVELSSGVLFLLFGIMSFLSGPEGEL